MCLVYVCMTVGCVCVCERESVVFVCVLSVGCKYECLVCLYQYVHVCDMCMHVCGVCVCVRVRARVCMRVNLAITRSWSI